VKDVQTLGRRVVEAVIISLACAGALWLVQNPVGAGELVARIVSLFAQVDPVWATVAAWAAAVLMALTIGIALLRRTEWGGSWLFGAGPIAGASFVFGLIATSLRMCAGGNVWGLVPAALAVWFTARLGLRVRRAWTRFWYPAII
jgi:hypothetical protein